MKLVIMVGGKSTRTHPLTLTRPKPLLKVANKTILQHNLEQIKGLFEEIIIVVGYKKEMIKEFVKGQFPELKVTFIEQKEQKGTGHAISLVKNCIEGRFVIIGGDDFFFEEDIKKIIKEESAILVKESDNASRFGVVDIKDGFYKKMLEKPKGVKRGFVNCGCYLLDQNIFPLLGKLKKSARGEYELVDGINEYSKQKKIKVVEAETWFPVSYAWDLIDINDYLLKNIKKRVDGKIERYVTIKGKLGLGKNSIIKSGVYMEGDVLIGEDCVLGPNCYIRGPVSIGNNCKIGQGVEIKNCVIFDNTKIPHLSYVGDSVIGENVNLAAGTITANLRHDYNEIKSEISGDIISTGRKKFGTIIGDNVKTGIKTKILPGRKLFPGKTTYPGEIIKKDVI